MLQSPVVTEEYVRPARPDGTCFYCRRAVGEEHQVECVGRKRTVVVEVTVRVRYVRELPEREPLGDLPIHGCRSNALAELDDVFNSEDPASCCLCSSPLGEVQMAAVREATEEDEASMPVYRW